MGKKYDDCVKDIQEKIKSGEMKKNYKCDSKGKPNKRGKKRCKSNAYKLCSRIR